MLPNANAFEARHKYKYKYKFILERGHKCASLTSTFSILFHSLAKLLYLPLNADWSIDDLGSRDHFFFSIFR